MEAEKTALINNESLTNTQTFYDVDYTQWLPSAATLHAKLDETYKKYCDANLYTPTVITLGSWTLRNT